MRVRKAYPENPRTLVLGGVNKLIHGEKGGRPPEYLHERWLKLKQVK